MFSGIDLPGSGRVQSALLASDVRPRRTCRRHVIAADLREGLDDAAAASGFAPDSPTLWVDEGALAYLPAPGRGRGVVADLTRLSAPGGRFGVSRYSVDANSAPYCRGWPAWSVAARRDRLRETVRDVTGMARQPRLGHGLQSWNDAVTRLNRAVTQADSEVGHIAAVLGPRGALGPNRVGFARQLLTGARVAPGSYIG